MSHLDTVIGTKYDNYQFDDCWKSGMNSINNQINDRYLDTNAYKRAGVVTAQPQGLGVNVSFYGPMTENLVNRDTFLSGRARVLSKCPSGEVISLPTDKFNPKNKVKYSVYSDPSYCQNTQLQMMGTRVNKSCNNLSEVDLSSYRSFPGAFSQGYLGFNIMDNTTSLQTRNAFYDFHSKAKPGCRSMAKYI